jgi:DUF4097 and DUF4098 domain-containing protein YvlB
MAKNCTGCGSELFQGQRFCRVCGRPSGDLPNESPTQAMPPGVMQPPPSVVPMDPPQPTSGQIPRGSTGPGQGVTAPTSSYTGPVSGQGFGYAGPAYRPGPPAPIYRPPPTKGFRWGWLLAFLGMGIFVLVVLAIFMAARNAGRRPRYFTPPSTSSAGPSSVAAGERDFGEENAVVLPNSTVVTRDFPLNNDADFTFNTNNGQISIEGWDQDKVEVTVTKTGRTQEDRSQATVVYSGDQDGLKIRGLDRSPRGVSLRYEVKLPRAHDNDAGIDVKVNNGEVKLSQVDGKISVQVLNGSIDLRNVKGALNVKSTNGSIDASFDALDDDEDHSLKFETSNGSITLQFKSALNADLKAQTATGSITIDSAFGVDVTKRIVGAEASGQIGDGDGDKRSLDVRTQNGSITIAK